jgi:hypothetical protein
MLEAFEVQSIHKTRKKKVSFVTMFAYNGKRMDLDRKRWAVDAHAKLTYARMAR